MWKKIAKLGQDHESHEEVRPDDIAGQIKKIADHLMFLEKKIDQLLDRQGGGNRNFQQRHNNGPRRYFSSHGNSNFQQGRGGSGGGGGRHRGDHNRNRDQRHNNGPRRPHAPSDYNEKFTQASQEPVEGNF